MVILWHVQPLRFTGNYDYSIFMKMVDYINNLFLYNITLTGVPSFYLISLFLFYGKLFSSANYLWKRVFAVMMIYVFWSIIQCLIYICFVDRIHLTSFGEIFYFIKMGGPTLPFVGDSVFYFLFDLMVLYFLAASFKLLNERWIAIVSVIIILASIIIFERAIILGKRVHYWSLYNFIIYIPISYYLNRYRDNIITNKTLLQLLFLSLLFMGHDIVIRYFGIKVPLYGRISIVILATSIFVFCNEKIKGNSEIIKVISSYSLGLFAVHKYSMFFGVLIVSLFFNIDNSIYGIKYAYVFVSGFVILLTPLLILLMKRIGLGRFVG